MSDVTGLADGHWQWSGWLTPKGRVIALFALLRFDAQTLWLLLPDADPRRIARCAATFRVPQQGQAHGSRRAPRRRWLRAAVTRVRLASGERFACRTRCRHPRCPTHAAHRRRARRAGRRCARAVESLRPRAMAYRDWIRHRPTRGRRSNCRSTGCTRTASRRAVTPDRKSSRARISWDRPNADWRCSKQIPMSPQAATSSMANARSAPSSVQPPTPRRTSSSPSSRWITAACSLRANDQSLRELSLLDGLAR